MILWQAELSDEETDRVTDEICDEICDRLETLWEQIKQELVPTDG